MFSAVPTLIQTPSIATKIVKIVCAQSCSMLLLESGETFAAGRNNDNKLGFGEKVHKSMVFVRDRSNVLFHAPLS